MKCFTLAKDGVLLHVIASPKASKNEIMGLYQDKCKIKIKAPPVDGEANEALVAFIAKFFGLTKKQVMLQKGGSSKQKSFLLSGITLEAATKALEKVITC